MQLLIFSCPGKQKSPPPAACNVIKVKNSAKYWCVGKSNGESILARASYGRFYWQAKEYRWEPRLPDAILSRDRISRIVQVATACIDASYSVQGHRRAPQQNHPKQISGFSTSFAATQCKAFDARILRKGSRVVVQSLSIPTAPAEIIQRRVSL